MSYSKSAIINVMVNSVQKAARGLVRDFGEVENLQVSRKGTGDFVSQADKQSEHTLITLLQKARPSYSFLTEESGHIASLSPNEDDMTWIVDPLDGTTNFLHGMPHFCITLALRKVDTIIAAVTYDPVRDELFTAERGQGAYMNRRRLRVCTHTRTDDILISVGCLSDLIVPVCRRDSTSVRCSGSAALDLAYVAAGRLDGAVLHNLKSWDVSAGLLLVWESGGFATDQQTQTTATWSTDHVIAASPSIHSQLLDASA